MMDELEQIRQEKIRALAEKQRRKSEAVGKPIELTDSSLLGTVGGHTLVVVDCWAPWCAPCRMIAPVVEELARDYAGRILFGKLNVDENQEMARKYGISGIPALLVFKKGDHVDTIVGTMPRERLEPKITQYLEG